MGFGSFSNDENNSFEQGLPLNQAAKNAAKVAVSQTKTQADDTTKAILDQLYGPGTPSGQDQGTDEANPAHTDQSNSATRAVTTHGGMANKSSNTNSNQTSEEQTKLEKIRRELFAKNYGGQFGVDQEMAKARREREEKEKQREKEEEEEKQRLEAEKAQMDEGLGSLLPAGKKTGAMFGKKQQQPIALRQAKTKTEINRGTSG